MKRWEEASETRFRQKQPTEREIPVRQRENLEQQVLKKFEDVAKKYGYHVFKGQGQTTDYYWKVTFTFNSAT